MQTFTDRVAVVTGAASGIGRATALQLAAQGCRLALVDVNEEQLQTTAAELSRNQVEVSAHRADVADREQMARLVDEVLAHHGQVHILVNNAGVVTLGLFEEQAYRDLEWIIGINLWGVIHGCKLFIPHLKQVDEAHIVNVASSAAILAPPRRSAYVLTKFAVRGLSECLRVELAPHNIGVTAVYPLIVRTNISKTTRTTKGPLPTKAGDPLSGGAHAPEFVAEHIVRAIRRNQARALVGGGMRLLPVAFDGVLARFLEQRG